MPGCFEHQKACLIEIEQTARKLDTNAHANFLMAENVAYQCMEDGQGNMPTLRLSWLIVPLRYNVVRFPSGRLKSIEMYPYTRGRNVEMD